MAAVAEVHRQHRIAGLEPGTVDGFVGRRAGVRLDVGVIGLKQLLGARDSDIFNLVSIFLTAVVAPSWITFGILIGKDTAHGLQHASADIVL